MTAARRDIDRGEGWDRNLRRIIAPTVTTECHDKVVLWVVRKASSAAEAAQVLAYLGLDAAACKQRCAQAKQQP